MSVSMCVKKKILLAAAICLGALFSWGCGIKSAPIAPNQPAMPRVSDLRAQAAGGAITLRWRHPADSRDATAYAVYRARISLDKAPCRGCPLMFGEVGRVRRAQDNGAYSFSEAGEPGFRYLYKVRPMYANGSTGPDSGAAQVDIGRDQ